MYKLDKYEIKQELSLIYITKDGKKFVDIDDAINYIKGRKNRSYFDIFKASVFSLTALAFLLSLIHHIVGWGL